MGGRKLDAEAKHKAKQAASSAPERVHGTCINGFDYPLPHPSNFTHSDSQHLVLFFMFLLSCLLPCFCLFASIFFCLRLVFTSQTYTTLSICFYFFFCNIIFAFLFSRLCVSGLRAELVHVELASEWRHYSCLIDAIWWKQASCRTQSDGDKTLESLRIKNKPRFKCDFCILPEIKAFHRAWFLGTWNCLIH